MATRSLDTLQAGRALAALAVLLYHTNWTLALPKYIGRELFPIFNSGYSGVHFFFVLSGFVIFLIHQKDVGRPHAVGQFLWKRVRRVYPPLWVVLLLLLPVFYLVPSLDTAGQTNPTTILCAFAVAPSPSDSLLAPEWTLRHEVLFYAIFALYIWRPRIGAKCALIWLAVSAILPWFRLAYPWSFYFSSYHLLFAFGVLACVAFKRGGGRHPRSLMIVGLVIFACAWGALTLRLTDDGPVTTIAFGLGAALAILGGATLERQGRLRIAGTLVFLGEASYSIYLVHFPAISALCKIITAVSHRIQLPGLLIFAVAALPALAIGIAFHLLLEKPLLGWLSRLGETRAGLKPIT
jgi:exopolysaccharide production protein ExoZ